MKKEIKTVDNIQYDLFSNFFKSDTESDYSNTVELWDAVPKYFVSRQAQEKLRDKNTRSLPVIERNIEIRNTKYRISIHPAQIKEKDGSYSSYYPSSNEELIEDVLRKMFTEQDSGIHYAAKEKSFVVFTVYRIAKELSQRNKTRNKEEIRKSLEILKRSHIEIFIGNDKEAVYSNPILSDVTRVREITDESIKGFLDAHSDTEWLARFPELVSASINNIRYRQFNYATMMTLRNQLSRWLHKRLSHNYINAGTATPYDILLSTIERDSRLLEQYSRTSDRIRALEDTLKELIDSRILSSFEVVERRVTGRKINDIKYRFYPHEDFVKEMKAANARINYARDSLKLVKMADNIKPRR